MHCVTSQRLNSGSFIGDPRRFYNAALLCPTTRRFWRNHLSLIGLSCIISSLPWWSNSNSVPNYFAPKATSIQTGAVVRTNGGCRMICDNQSLKTPSIMQHDETANSNKMPACLLAGWMPNSLKHANLILVFSPGIPANLFCIQRE